MYHVMACTLVVASAVSASAECILPRETLFACAFENSDRWVEVCAILDAGDMSYEEQVTYHFSSNDGAVNTFFHPLTAYGNYRHYGEGVDNAFAGVGFEYNGKIYAVYATGSFETNALYTGFLEMYENLEQFSSDEMGVETLHLECNNFTLRGNFDFFAP